MPYGNIKKLTIVEDQVVEMDTFIDRGLLSIKETLEKAKEDKAKKLENDILKMSNETSRGEFLDLE